MAIEFLVALGLAIALLAGLDWLGMHLIIGLKTRSVTTMSRQCPYFARDALKEPVRNPKVFPHSPPMHRRTNRGQQIKSWFALAL